jgi:hypothetical protein
MKKFTNLFALSLLRKIFSTLLILVVTTGISMAQALVASARISGLLLDDSGKPMVYATVSLLNALDSSVAKGAITSETGVYSFGHLKAGVYLIEASAVGYKIARSQQITIIGNSIVTVPEIKMQSNSHILSAVSVQLLNP